MKSNARIARCFSYLGTLTLALKSERQADRTTHYVIEAGPLASPDAARLICTAFLIKDLPCRSDTAFLAPTP